MALNLWKLGGQPTSYNPLSGVMAVPVGIGDYIITVKAKSTSGGSLKCWVSPAELSSTGMVALSPTNTTYTFNKKVTTSGQNLQISPNTGVTDIIIQDIQLVQKPLPQPKRKLNPKRYVPKKNLVQTDVGAWEQGNTYPAPRTDRLRTKGQYPITQGKTLTVSCDFSKYDIGFVTFSDSVGTMVIDNGWKTAPFIFTPNSNEKYFRVVVRVKGTDGTVMSPSDISIAQPMVEEGTTATPYEPYQLVLPKAKTGQAFNGTTDYLQLPSMTMDSIEIDCLIEGYNSYGHVFDSRSGLADGYILVSGSPLTLGDGIQSVSGFNGVGIRSKIKIIPKSVITDDVTIFGSGIGVNNRTKGTIYKVTCYLGNQVVATYDFENPSNIVGDKVIPQAKNLIPSFEDARWSLHANADVLGKDVLRLEATGSWQHSTNVLNLQPNKQYLAVFEKGVISIDSYNVSNAKTVLKSVHTSPQIITVPNDSVRVEFLCTSNVAGTFDFIKPALYELNGKEGTIVGVPSKLRKPSKRTLYRKR